MFEDELHVFGAKNLVLVKVKNLKYDEQAGLKVTTEESQHVLQPFVVVNQFVAVHVHQLHQSVSDDLTKHEVLLDSFLSHIP